MHSRARVGVTKFVAFAVMTCALAIGRADAQCDPVVCANPYSSQTLPSSVSMSESALPFKQSQSQSQSHGHGLAAGASGAASQFESLSFQVQVPQYPTTVYPWIGIQFYAQFTGSMQMSNAPDPNAFYPVELDATLFWAASSNPPMYYVESGMGVEAPGFNSSATLMSAPFGVVSITLLNTPGVGLQVVMSDANPENPQHATFNSGYLPTAMAPGSGQVQLGMRVQTLQGTLAQTSCTVLPPAPYEVQFYNISLATSDGPVSLAMSVTPVTEPWCSLGVSVDNNAGITTFQWAASASASDE